MFKIFSRFSARISFFQPNVKDRSSARVFGEILISSTASSSVNPQSLTSFCFAFFAATPLLILSAFGWGHLITNLLMLEEERKTH